MALAATGDYSSQSGERWIKIVLSQIPNHLIADASAQIAMAFAPVNINSD